MSAPTSFLGQLGSSFRRSVPPTETVGTSGTVILSGFIVSNEKNTKVNEDRYQTYSDLLVNVDIIGASVRYYLNLGSKAEWTVEPADDSDAAQEVADFVDEVINDMRTPWYRVVRRSLMHRYYGFSIQEWTAKRREDGRIGLLDIEARPQHTIERWDTDPGGHVEGMVQRAPTTGEELYLPRAKVIYVVDDSLADSPEGLGLFRHMAETAARLQRYQVLEKFGFENDLRGIPKGRAPYAHLRDAVKANRLTEAERATILAPLEGFIKKHLTNPELGIAIDSEVWRGRGEDATPSSTPLWDLELLTGGTTGIAAVGNAIERLQRELARLAGTEGLLLGGDKVGSLALSRDKTQNFALVVDSALTELREVYDKDVIGTIMLLNGIPDDLWPVFKVEQIQYRDVEQISGVLVDLGQAGAPLLPGDPAINVLRSLLGLPDQPEPDLEDLNLRGGAGGGDPNPDDLPGSDDDDPPPGPEPDPPENG